MNPYPLAAVAAVQSPPSFVLLVAVAVGALILVAALSFLSLFSFQG